MIHQISNSFDFSHLVLNKPILINGHYTINFSSNDKPFYLQFPQCKLKSRIQKSGKKMFSELIFTNENEKLIDWMEKLEDHCKKSIFENRAWFDTDLDEDDIDSFFISCLKSFKLGRYYTMRVNVPIDLGIYHDEGDNKLSFEDVHDNTNVLTIIEFIGIKCSDKNFQIEAEVKQMLVVKELFEKCLIKVNSDEVVKKETIVEPVIYEPVKYLEDPIVEPVKEELIDEMVKEEPVVKPVKEELIDEKIKEDPINENIESINLEEFVEDEKPIKLKPRNDIYQKMYKEAKEKAKIAKRMALMAYLEAKRIKNEYMIDDINDSENEQDF